MSKTIKSSGPKKPSAKQKSEFIIVEKDGEQIPVHPFSLENHLQLGWKVVEAVSVETEDANPPADNESKDDAEED